MNDHPTRLELYNAGKLEERRYPRHQPDPVVEVQNDKGESGSISIRPEIIAIAVLVVVLLVVTAIAL
jgi:hypothetical protein